MDIKQYIDYFPVISALPRNQQFTIIEKAIEKVNANYKFPLLNWLPSFVQILLITGFCGGGYLWLGMAPLVLLGAFIGAILVSRVVVSEVNEKLILKAINQLMEQEKKQSTQSQ